MERLTAFSCTGCYAWNVTSMQIGIIGDDGAIVTGGGITTGVEVVFSADGLTVVSHAVTAGEEKCVVVFPVILDAGFTFPVDTGFDVGLARVLASTTVFVVVTPVCFASRRGVAVQVIWIADGDDTFSIDARNLAICRTNCAFSVKIVVTVMVDLSAMEWIGIEIDIATVHEFKIGIRPAFGAPVARCIEV